MIDHVFPNKEFKGTIDDEGFINGEHIIHKGMRLRDYFAGQALSGSCANQDSPMPDYERTATHCYNVGRCHA